MPKQSKNLGITKACPKCRKIIIFGANFTGFGSEWMKCPYCGAKVFKEIFQKTVIILTLASILLFIGILIHTLQNSETAKQATLDIKPHD